MPHRSVWFAAISVIICSIWLTACVPGIMGSKASKEKTSGAAATTNPSRLLKPTMPDERGRGSVAQQAGKEKPGDASGTSSDTFAASAKGAKAGNRLLKKSPLSRTILEGKSQDPASTRSPAVNRHLRAQRAARPPGPWWKTSAGSPQLPKSPARKHPRRTSSHSRSTTM